jgi:hypothetical protein
MEAAVRETLTFRSGPDGKNKHLCRPFFSNSLRELNTQRQIQIEIDLAVC